MFPSKKMVFSPTNIIIYRYFALPIPCLHFEQIWYVELAIIFVQTDRHLRDNIVDIKTGCLHFPRMLFLEPILDQAYLDARPTSCVSILPATVLKEPHVPVPADRQLSSQLGQQTSKFLNWSTYLLLFLAHTLIYRYCHFIHLYLYLCHLHVQFFVDQ